MIDYYNAGWHKGFLSDELANVPAPIGKNKNLFEAGFACGKRERELADSWAAEAAA